MEFRCHGLCRGPDEFPGKTAATVQQGGGSLDFDALNGGRAACADGIQGACGIPFRVAAIGIVVADA